MVRRVSRRYAALRPEHCRTSEGSELDPCRPWWVAIWPRDTNTPVALRKPKPSSSACRTCIRISSSARYLVGLYSKLSNFAAAESEAQDYFKLTGEDTPLQMVRIQREAATGSMDKARRNVSFLLNGKSDCVSAPTKRRRSSLPLGRKRQATRPLKRLTTRNPGGW